jgi:hypothetical protein
MQALLRFALALSEKRFKDVADGLLKSYGTDLTQKLMKTAILIQSYGFLRPLQFPDECDAATNRQCLSDV